MSREILLPPPANLLPDGSKLGGWWHTAEDERIVCDLCPRECHLKPGDRGFCFVRENRDGEMVLSTYGKSTGFCIDPIEKKPLNHFYPGTSVLSFGTAGCNLGCKFCQNWDISKSREVERLSDHATPDMIAEAAHRLGCHSVAYTYNDPVIWAEYAIDVARACRALGVKSVAVTAGYIMPEARGPFFHEMDAANVDLKAFTEEFYKKITYSHLRPVLDTLHWLKHESDVWFEITNLVIPGENDSPDELRQMCEWILAEVGDEVPMHFSAFHPDWRMLDKPRTPPETLLMAREIALQAGIKFAYVGNVDDVKNQSTYCPQCGGLLIQRNWYELGVYHLDHHRCGHCGNKIAGRFQQQPGNWGRKRQPVRISQFASSPSVVPLDIRKSARTMTTSPVSTTSRSPMLDVPTSPELTAQQEAAIHLAACEVVAAGVCRRRPQLSDPSMAGSHELTVMGAFVTLKRAGRLRACCGVLGQPMPLGEAVQKSALRTATEDTRFPTISPTELADLHLDVTLLYGFQPITATGEDRVAEVEVGKHGLQIQRGNQSGLLLPSVAPENGWNAREFLGHVCRKAGLPTTAWLDDDTRLLRFEGRMLPGDFNTDVLADSETQPVYPFTPDELATLAQQVRANVIALAHGATPNYYLPGCPDGTVQGIAISVQQPDDDRPWRTFQMSLRPGIPLQATLFKMAETAATSLRRDAVGANRLQQIRLNLSVFFDPAMHGTADGADVSSVKSDQRAVLVVEGAKSAIVFDPSLAAEQLLEQACQDAAVQSPAAASVFSLGVLSTESPVAIANVPRAQAGPAVRPPGVAGMFYPADAQELSNMVDDMLADGDTEPAHWPAMMVPHAGLVYSGRLAAQTMRRVKFPKTVIVIGPKHTPYGVEWAVAPNDVWSLPTGNLAGDSGLARTLADRITGLELDSAAHQREHAIEVELPLVQRLAPDTRVVGIALGGGDFASCQRFATELADVLRELDEMPLLMISSDMNHFATDEENRRLDEIALQSLETLDPANVFDTVVTRHNISMCGVRPAVIVMETLRQLNGLNKCERVGYATSADVSGDKSRVVGYAGMLFG